MIIFKTFILCLFLFFTTGCTRQSIEEEKPLIIGFSQSGTESNWRKTHTSSIVTELEQNKYQVLYRNGFMNQERQVEDIRTFISYKVDLILFTPLTESGWETVLTEAKQAGIPVIIVDRHIQVTDSELYLTRIGPSFKAEGHRAGIFINNYFSDKEVDSIKILELSGLQETSPTILRSEGFKEWIARDERMEVVDSLQGDFIRMKGKDQILEYLKTHDLSKIDVLFSHNDEMTHGALEALKETNIVPGKDLTIVTIDGQADMIEQLKQGVVNCVVECNPNVGFDVANTINRYFTGFYDGKTMPKEIFVYETVFTQHNIDNIPTRNY